MRQFWNFLLAVLFLVFGCSVAAAVKMLEGVARQFEPSGDISCDFAIVLESGQQNGTEPGIMIDHPFYMEVEKISCQSLSCAMY